MGYPIAACVFGTLGAAVRPLSQAKRIHRPTPFQENLLEVANVLMELNN